MRNKKVSLHFLPELKEAMLADQVTAITGTSPYGYPGDYFEQWGRTFIITEVTRTKLGAIAMLHCQDQGFETPEGFTSFWKKQHPRRIYSLGQYAYLHQFRLQTLLIPPFHAHVFNNGICEKCGIGFTPKSTAEVLI